MSAKGYSSDSSIFPDKAPAKTKLSGPEINSTWLRRKKWAICYPYRVCVLAYVIILFSINYKILE